MSQIRHIEGTKLFIDGKPVYEYTENFRGSIFENCRISVRANAVIFNNVGDDDVTLSGMTLKAGASKTVGDTSSLIGIFVKEYDIKFAGRGSSPQLEWSTLDVVGIPELSSYIEQKRR